MGIVWVGNVWGVGGWCRWDGMGDDPMGDDDVGGWCGGG